jgi:CheY-like chemotaxis protein
MARILIVDDDKHIAAILNELLLIDGYQVTIAYNAKDAFSFLAEFTVDLMITDILMPNIDGIEFIKAVREINNVPIIAMSGGRRSLTPANTIINKSTANLKLSNALAVGANSTLTKPFVRAQLQEAVKNVLNA